MQQKTMNLFDVPYEALLTQVKGYVSIYEYDYQKHVIRLLNAEGEAIGYIRLPLHLSIDHELNVLDRHASVLYLSIESGNAAISIMEGLTNIYHTTFSAYMSRKKQGVSQIKYLNKKGKSKAGSRVRLAATVDFFEKINTTLNELFDHHQFTRIAVNCNTTLIPYLHGSKIPCPFDKKSPDLYKIPLHIPLSNHTNLEKVIKKLMAPFLFYHVKSEEVVKKVFSPLLV